MEYQISVLLSGIAVGGQYALIAIGYTMVYGILRLINFAHGDVFMVAGLLGIYLSASFPLYVSLPLVIVLTVLFALAAAACDSAAICCISFAAVTAASAAASA